MYKIIFADDESIVRNTISKLINWNDFGFKLIAVCKNGHEIIEALEAQTPDVVITDINMPFIDGLDVAKIIQENYPSVKVVLLTGYNNFFYAQKAIDLAVKRYICKPISAKELTTLLEQLKAQLDDEYSNLQNTLKYQRFYRDNFELMQFMLINNILFKNYNELKIDSQIEQSKLFFLKTSKLKVCIFIENELSINSMWEDSTQSLRSFSILNITNEIICNNNLGIAILNDNKIIAILNDEDEDKSSRCISDIVFCISHHLKFNVNAGIGNTISNYHNLNHSFTEANNALQYLQISKDSQVIYICDVEPLVNNITIFDFDKEKKLLNIVGFENDAALSLYINELFSEIGEITPATYTYTLSILTALLRKDNSITNIQSTLLDYCDIRKIVQLNSVFDMKNYIYKVAQKISKNIKNSRNNEKNKSIENAITFIHQNINNENLTVEMVSKHILLSTSYFRSIFKKELNITFGNYLTQQRMEKAKELLLNSDLKIYTIAEQVGYTDPHYFSYSFKKYFKFSPNDVRKKEVE